MLFAHRVISGPFAGLHSARTDEPSISTAHVTSQYHSLLRQNLLLLWFDTIVLQPFQFMHLMAKVLTGYTQIPKIAKPKSENFLPHAVLVGLKAK